MQYKENGKSLSVRGNMSLWFNIILVQKMLTYHFGPKTCKFFTTVSSFEFYNNVNFGPN
jgi:hypothetical protein